MQIIKRGGTMLTAAIAIIAATQGAWALDGQDFATKLSSVFEANGMAISFTSADVQGDTITLSGITAAPIGLDGVGVPGEIVFTGVAETGEGGYTAEKAETGAISLEEEDVAFSIENITMGKLTIAADPLEDPLAYVTLYETFDMGKLTVTVEGNDIVTVERATASNIPNADNTVFETAYDVTGIHAEPGKLDIDEAAQMIALLELEVIDANAKGAGVWNIDTGLLEVSESSITIDKVGKLDFTGSVGGYDLDVLTQLLEMNRAMAEAGADMTAEELDAQSMQMMMALGSKLSLIGASIRFDDYSITGKVLDLIAEMNGAPREVMVAGFAAAVPAMAAEAGLSTEMQAKLGDAVATFLADPKNIEISVSPAEPTPFLALAGMAAQPAALESFIGLDVQANQ